MLVKHGKTRALLAKTVAARKTTAHWISTDDDRVSPQGIPSDSYISTTRPTQPFKLTIAILTDDYRIMFHKGRDFPELFGGADNTDGGIIPGYKKDGIAVLAGLESPFRALAINPTLVDLAQTNTMHSLCVRGDRATPTFSVKDRETFYVDYFSILGETDGDQEDDQEDDQDQDS